MSELALSISHVSKEYRLGVIGGATLRGEIQSKLARLRGKEDPNLKIGEKAHEKNERFLALDDVSFDVKKGERIGILGHNGAGKSTLLKLICRVTTPTKGEIRMNGRITSMLEVGTGFHGELTGRENIYLNGAILGLSKAEIEERFDEIVAFSEVGQFIDTPVKRYSSGMHVKLGFAVASHLDSEIMIMDEVLAVGDMAFQKKGIERMRQVAEDEGRTILYVSHNMTTIRDLCERCIVLEHGKIIFDGDVEKAISIYMHDEATSDTRINYHNIPRLHWLANTYVKTDLAEFVGKDDNVFTKNEELDIRIKWTNEKDVNNLCLRVEILDITRHPIGSAFFDNIYSGNEGDQGEIRVQIPLMELVPDTYTMNYVFFLKDDHGLNTDVDCVHGLYFKIEGELEIRWNSKVWGSIEIKNGSVAEN